MKKLFLLICTVYSLNALAQVVAADIEYNNVRARVNNNGIWFRCYPDSTNIWGKAGFEVPKDEGASSIYSAGFWMGGLSTDQSLKLAAVRFGEDEYEEYSVGPKADNSISQEFLDKYNHIWRITQLQILEHQVNYANPDYEMPWAIATWPGNGNTANGEAQLLAPFIDLNSDGIYSPEQGDYPDIRGDEALYFMQNDYNNPHLESGGSPIGVNIHAMTYSYAVSENSPLNDCVFVSLKIRNEGTQSLSDFYFGTYADFDIGAYIDDYIASDSLRNMMYGYNGDGFDEGGGGALGYGSFLPAQGAMFLNHSMAKALYYNNNNSSNGDPSQPIHYYNYMRGIWGDNSLVTEGGSGYGGTVHANYMFSGDPVTNTGWTEVNAGNQPGDRRIIMSAGPFSFAPGEQLCIDLAFPFARSSQEHNNLDAITELRQAADFIQNFYDSQNFNCNLQVAGIDEKRNDGNVAAVFPNPNNGRFYLTAREEISSVNVYDSMGKIVFSKTFSRNNNTSVEVDLTQYPSGVYLYRLLSSKGSLSTGKVVVE